MLLVGGYGERPAQRAGALVAKVCLALLIAMNAAGLSYILAEVIGRS